MKIELFYVASFVGEELQEVHAGPFVCFELARNAQSQCAMFEFGSRYLKVVKTEHQGKDYYD
jgi:hypothetical protein